MQVSNNVHAALERISTEIDMLTLHIDRTNKMHDRERYVALRREMTVLGLRLFRMAQAA